MGAGLPSVALGLLEAWVAAHATKPSALKGLDTADVTAIPRWVDALLLVLDACTHIDWQAPTPEAAVSAPEQPSASDLAAPEAEQACSPYLHLVSYMLVRDESFLGRHVTVDVGWSHGTLLFARHSRQT